MSSQTVNRTAGQEPARIAGAGIDADAILPEPGDEFVFSPCVRDLTERALAYLEADYPIHFSGPAGTGKTTLAFHVAAKRGRPVVLIHGDDEFGSSDLVGRDSGFRRHKVIDNFIHSVLKTEEEMKSLWVANRLTTACQGGATLIYDEFNRSRPEANNALLSILSEKLLNLPKLHRSAESYLEVHPAFRAIFTSNPEEYAGVHKTQDALLDRLITISLGHYDRETEVMITMKKSGIRRQDAELIVDVVRKLRETGVSKSRPTIRAAIAIARIVARKGGRASLDDPIFLWTCRDVLNMDGAKVSRAGKPVMPHRVEEVLQRVCKVRAGNLKGRVSAEETEVVSKEKEERHGRPSGESTWSEEYADPIGKD